MKFQNITSLIIDVESGDGVQEKIRLDRVKLIDECGEKKEMMNLKIFHRLLGPSMPLLM